MACSRALSRDPRRRPSAASLATVLEAAADRLEAPASARVVDLHPRPPRGPRRIATAAHPAPVAPSAASLTRSRRGRARGGRELAPDIGSPGTARRARMCDRTARRARCRGGGGRRGGSAHVPVLARLADDAACARVRWTRARRALVGCAARARRLRSRPREPLVGACVGVRAARGALAVRLGRFRPTGTAAGARAGSSRPASRFPLYLIAAGRLRSAPGRALAGAAGPVAIALWAAHASAAAYTGTDDVAAVLRALEHGAGAPLVAQAVAWGAVAMAWPLAWSGWRVGRASGADDLALPRAGRPGRSCLQRSGPPPRPRSAAPARSRPLLSSWP